jgi:hypothetical protein
VEGNSFRKGVADLRWNAPEINTLVRLGCG